MKRLFYLKKNVNEYSYLGAPANESSLRKNCAAVTCSALSFWQKSRGNSITPKRISLHPFARNRIEKIEKSERMEKAQNRFTNFS